MKSNIPKINWNLLPPKKLLKMKFFKVWIAELEIFQILFELDLILSLHLGQPSTKIDSQPPKFRQDDYKRNELQNKVWIFPLTLTWLDDDSLFYPLHFDQIVELSSQFEICWPFPHPRLIKFLIFQHMM